MVNFFKNNFFGKKFLSLIHKSWSLIAYGWYFLFLLTPMAIVVSLTFSQWRIGSPPYEPLWQWIDGNLFQLRLFFGNYSLIFHDPHYFYYRAFLQSFSIAALSTFICLIIAYPMAYGISKTRYHWIWLMASILPFFTSFLVRVYAWINLLGTPNGIINHFLGFFNIGPLPLMHNTFSVVVGIVYSYLPFMIVPIYLSLKKIDRNLLEAAYDLGCKPFNAFWRVIFPLSRPGMMAGSSLVFIPCIGEYIIPELLGGMGSVTIGRLIWLEFFTNADWSVAASLALLMIVFLAIPIFTFEKIQNYLEK